ncbi:hypothetical protein [Parashewanella tropica]|uniref:hypothetical protein n=1 Tax=Parashewanella tropica TaxID=2547970 RepID=UPI0010592A73|nr:hypothetical protein [Parashewanella tropica]
MNKLETNTQAQLIYANKESEIIQQDEASQLREIKFTEETTRLLVKLFYEEYAEKEAFDHFNKITKDFSRVLPGAEIEMTEFCHDTEPAAKPTLSQTMLSGKYGTFKQLQQALPEHLHAFLEVTVTDNGTVNYIVDGRLFHSESLTDLLLEIKNEEGRGLIKHLPEDLRQYVIANKNDFTHWLTINEPKIDTEKTVDDLVKQGSADALVPTLKYYLSEHPCGVEVKVLLDQLQLAEFALSDALDRMENPSAPEKGASNEEWEHYAEVTGIKGHLMNLNVAYLLLSQD